MKTEIEGLMKKFAILIKIIISVTLIYLVMRRMDISQLSQIWHSVNLSYILPAFLLYLVCMFTNCIKWQILLNIQGLRIPLRRVMGHYLVGYFFNNFLTGVGEVKRVYDLSRETGKCHAVVASVFIERWTGIVCQVGMAIVAMVYAYREMPKLHNILLVCGALFLLLLLMFIMAGRLCHFPLIQRIKPIHNWLETFKTAYDEYVRNPRALFTAFLFSFIPPVMLIFIHWLLTISVTGSNMGIGPFVIFIPVISVFSQVPVSINGIGVQEVLFVELFRLVHITPETAFTVSVLSHVLKMGVGAPGGIIYLMEKEKTVPVEEIAVICRKDSEKDGVVVDS